MAQCEGSSEYGTFVFAARAHGGSAGLQPLANSSSGSVAHGVPAAQAYNTTMYLMAALLVIGFICNACVKAVDARHT